MTNKLSELELQVAELREALAASEKEKRALLKIVSHDIKAPFNQLFALSSLLSMDSDNLTEDQVDYVERMDIVAKEGLSLIRNLVDLRTIDYRGIQYREDKINVEEILKETINHHSPAAARKEIIITQELQPASTILDKIYVGRIFDHLISNAIKFAPPGSSVYVNMLVDGKQIQVRIADEGEGIPQQEVNSLFKQFIVLSPRPTAGESTTGLGLYLAKAMAEGLQGNVSYIADTSRTIFEVTMPMNNVLAVKPV